jgi:hypothetical protein
MLLPDSAKQLISVKARGDIHADMRLAKAVPFRLGLDLVRTHGSTDLSGLSLRRFILKSRGSEARFSVKAPPSPCPDSVRVFVRRGSLSFDHFGALNAPVFRADLRGGKAILDFRGMKGDMDGAVSIRGGRTILVFPEEAAVTISRTTSALSCIFGKGFEVKGDQVLKQGSGPSCTIKLEAWGGGLVLLSAGEDVSLEEALEGVRDADWIKQITLDDLDDYVRYNRVEGLYLGAVYDSRRVQKKELGVIGKLGYAISQKLAEYEVGATFGRKFARSELNLKLAHGKKADSDDDWKISTGENTLQMFLFGNDYKDYFLSKYTDLSGSLKIGPSLTLSGKAGADEYGPLDKKANWYLFGSDSLAIRGNHWIAKGKDHYLQAAVDFKNAGDLFPRQGFHAFFKGEYSGGAIKSDYCYRKAVGDVRGYYPCSNRAEFSLRGYAGEVTGKAGRQWIPNQKMFDFGGLATVRGFSHLADWTLMDKNRMFFLSSEFKYAGQISRDVYFPLVSGLFNKALFIFFFDAGRAWNTEDNGKVNTNFNNIIPEIKPDKFHKTFGLGLADRNEHLRIDFMRLLRTDREKDDRIEDRVNIRFARAF